MDPEDNHLSDEDVAANNAATDDAFASGFQGPNGHEAPQDANTLEPDDAPAPPAEPPKPAASATPPAPVPEDDPFANLHPKVRELLAEVPNLKHQLQSANGRIAALQRTPAPTPAPAAPAPAEPVNPARERLRRELPEVAEALDEADAKRQPASAPAPTQQPQPEVTRTEDEKTLDEEFPDWVDTIRGTDFNLWLSSQPTDYANKVRSTEKAAVITAAIAKFDSRVKPAAAPAPAPAAPAPSPGRRVAEQRNTRVIASTQPASSGARPTARTPIDDEEEDAFSKGFNSA